MVLDRVLGDLEDVARSLCWPALGQVLEDLDLAGGERLKFILRAASRPRLLGNPALAGGNGTDGRDELLAR